MTQFLSNAINFGGQLLLPRYFLQVRGASPGLTGLLLAQTCRAPAYASFGGGVSSMLATLLRRIAADW